MFWTMLELGCLEVIRSLVVAGYSGAYSAQVLYSVCAVHCMFLDLCLCYMYLNFVNQLN